MLARWTIPEIAHCSEGHSSDPGMTVNCPLFLIFCA